MAHVLSVIDTLSVQNYIFGTNRLREQIGASYLVKQITEQWSKEAIQQYGAERIMTGGGNTLYASDSLDTARAVLTTLSKRIIEEAPGVEIAAAHLEYKDSDAIGGEAGVYNRLFQKLAQQKQHRIPIFPTQSYGVTLECRSSGAPAVVFAPQRGDDTSSYAVSTAIMAKVKDSVWNDANATICKLLPAGTLDEYQLSNDFDNMGRRSGEQSYIAVVHADGNGIGQRFREIIEAEKFSDPSQNAACLEAIQSLSIAINQAGQTALANMVTRMLKGFKSNSASEQLKQFLQELRSRQKNALPFLPFRPIVFGGDDVTFVCDGALGLSLAAMYLEEFERAAADLPGGAGYACAGVAIVKVHYPFARAYALAEELCKSAKTALTERRKQGSAMDWHIAQSGLSGGLKEIREREYVVKAGKLYQRPLTLYADSFSPAWRTWKQFAATMMAFQQPQWAERHNKLIGLREELRNGKEAVIKYRDSFMLPELPTLAHTDVNTHLNGWHGDICGYFDVIEALDYLLLLTEQTVGGNS